MNAAGRFADRMMAGLEDCNIVMDICIDMSSEEVAGIISQLRFRPLSSLPSAEWMKRQS